jgi:hypothetical protein
MPCAQFFYICDVYYDMRTAALASLTLTLFLPLSPSSPFSHLDQCRAAQRYLAASYPGGDGFPHRAEHGENAEGWGRCGEVWVGGEEVRGRVIEGRGGGRREREGEGGGGWVGGWGGGD